MKGSCTGFYKGSCKGLYNPGSETPYRLPLWYWAPKDHPYHCGFGEPNSIMVVHMEPLDKGQINARGGSLPQGRHEA